MQNTAAQPLPSNRQTRKQPSWGLIALVVALVAALLIGLLAIGAYFLLSTQRATQWTWQDPQPAVDTTRVRPDLSVLALTGEPINAIVQEAHAVGEPDSAYAILVYNATLGDAERSGNLRLVARAFEEAGAFDLAALSYQQLHSLAALSPTLSDAERADASLTAAEGFIRLGMPDAARPSLAQAEVLARYSPLLAPVKKQRIAESLVALYVGAGMADDAKQAAQWMREVGGLPDARLVRGPYLSSFQVSPVEPQQLADARLARQRRALDFVAAWDTTGSVDEQARANLASALLQEDGIRQAVFAAEIEASPQLVAKAGTLQSYINWLTLKLMIAEQGMGFSLVPEWETQAENIRVQLAQAYDTLYRNYADQVGALPSAGDRGFARVEVLRDAMLKGRLGFYPDYPEQGLADRLQAAQEEIADQLPLLVVDEPWGDGRIFRLAESFF
jgi:hypothetical protein